MRKILKKVIENKKEFKKIRRKSIEESENK
jgi:hypothetical protein